MTFTWRKDNVLMPGQTAPALVLTNVTNTHTGNYSFTVTNDLGSVTGTFPLKVVVPPQCTFTPVPNGLQLGYPTLTGQVYTTEESTNLLTGWRAWPGSFVGNGLTNYFTVKLRHEVLSRAGRMIPSAFRNRNRPVCQGWFSPGISSNCALADRLLGKEW